MSPRRLLALSGLAAALLAPTAAAARPAPITGSLAKKGYTLIAVGYDGRSTSVVVRGSFRLVPPARKVTLQLRAPNGKYAGPVVVGGSATKAIVGVHAGARLGALKLTKAIARPAHALSPRFLDGKRTATARKGVPIGAGLFGRVRAAAKGTSGPGADQDLDGIPGAFDVDDDGDLVLDNMEHSAGARASQLGGDPDRFWVFSNFHLEFADAINANAGGVSDAAIDKVLTGSDHFAGLAMQVPDGGAVELDCGGLVYCSSGGTGRVAEPQPDGLAFPDCCDPDHDGMGTLSKASSGDFQLRTLAPASKLGTGDTFVEHMGDRELPGVLNYMFNTTPAVHAYSDGSGVGGLVTYPVSADSPFTQSHPFALHPDASGNLTLTLSFWRPQRRAIAGSGEGDGFVDIGGLGYQINVPNAPNGVTTPGAAAPPARGPQSCSAASTTTADPSLTPASPFGYQDTAPDRPADAANLLTFTVNFTACLASAGLTLQPGQTLGFEIQARSEVNDNADQGMTVCLPPAGSSTCPSAGPGAGPPPPGSPPAGP